MDGSNEQSVDGQNNNLDVNSLISAQNLKLDHLTEVLRNTLNDFGQNLGKHLGELINNKPNNPGHDSTSEPAIKRQRVQAFTYEYDADKALGLTTQNMMDLCLPGIDLIMIYAIKMDLKTRPEIGLTAQPLMSLKTQMGIGHLRQDGGKDQKPQRAKITRANDM